MGFTTTWSQIYFKKIPAADLTKKNWLIILSQLMEKLKVDGDVPAKYIIDESSGEGLECPSSKVEDKTERKHYVPLVDVQYLFGFANDYLNGKKLYCLFEDGCPEALEQMKDKITLETLNVDEPERDSGFEGDTNYVYFVYGAFGKSYPGSMFGRVRYNDEESIKNFNFLLDIDFLKPYQACHVTLCSNALEDFPLFTDAKRSKCLQNFREALPIKANEEDLRNAILKQLFIN